MDEPIDIGEVRGRTGLPASTLHYYERHGLISSVERAGLRRQYAPDTIERVAVIVLCQRAGFSLDEIAELLATGGESGWKDLVQTKLAKVRSQIRDLRVIERGLTHALRCPSDNVLRCEHFCAELDAVIPVDHMHRHRREQPPATVSARRVAKGAAKTS
jgi:DNA-binding transcriptional MerR regulator